MYAHTKLTQGCAGACALRRILIVMAGRIVWMRASWIHTSKLQVSVAAATMILSTRTEILLPTASTPAPTMLRRCIQEHVVVVWTLATMSVWIQAMTTVTVWPTATTAAQPRRLRLNLANAAAAPRITIQTVTTLQIATMHAHTMATRQHLDPAAVA